MLLQCKRKHTSEHWYLTFAITAGVAAKQPSAAIELRYKIQFWEEAQSGQGMSDRKINEKEKAGLLTLARSCEDHAPSDQVEKMAKNLCRRIEAVPLTKSAASRLEKLLRDSLEAMQTGQENTAVLLLQRSFEIWMTSASEKKEEAAGRKGIMGIIKWVGNLLTGNKESGTEAGMVSAELEKAQAQMIELQNRISSLYDKHSSRMKELEQLAAGCAGHAKDSDKYKRTRIQARPLMAEVTSLESEIEKTAKLLEQNIRYRSLLKEGQTNFELQKYLPDKAKSQAVMSMITENAEQLQGDLQDMNDSLGENERRMKDAANMGTSSREEEDLFDRLAAEAGKEAEKPETGPEIFTGTVKPVPADTDESAGTPAQTAAAAEGMPSGPVRTDPAPGQAEESNPAEVFDS